MKSGIYGCRKRLLYLVIFLIGILVIVNFAFSVWLFILLKPSMVGFGPVEIVGSDRIDINGDLKILGDLKTKTIETESSLDIISSDSINFKVTKKITSSFRTLGSMMKIDSTGVSFIGERISIQTRNGTPLITTKDSFIDFHNAKLLLNANLDLGSVKTNHITSSSRNLNISSTEQLNIHAPRSLEIHSGEEVEIEAKDILKMQSKSIVFESAHVYLPYLPVIDLPGENDFEDSYEDALHICVGQGGKLFAAENCLVV